MKLVYIKWVDCVSSAGWAEDPKEDIATGSENCETVGWLVLDEPDFIVVAASRNDAGGFADRTRFPRRMIVSISDIHSGGYSPQITLAEDRLTA